jgi:ribosome-binding protein aMBF1 (putative translation factor)
MRSQGGLNERVGPKASAKQQSPTLENSQAPTTPARKVRDRRKMRQAKLAKAISKQDGVIDRSGHQALSSKNQFEASLRQELGLP